ncbi:MAG: DUF4071 domain-containing protein [Bacteroidia bacterium]|nr:DUF4071 domain-containing protein [Bacteroidia bacterium]
MTKVEQIEKLIHQGHYFEARSLATSTLSESDDLRVKQLHALAISKSGGAQAAKDYLEPIYQKHPEDPETAGILGGIYKELFKNSQETKYALLSRDTYHQNFTATGNYYTGINAATMSIIAGKAAKGKEIAGELINKLSESSSDFWEVATLAEAHLIKRDKTKAMSLYFQVIQMAGDDWGKINSVFNQLWLLNHYLPVPSEILKAFSPPTVVAFVGHMIDHQDRLMPRFPEVIELKVKNSISNAIKTLHAKIGYCSLACGSDILFAEAMAETNAQVTIYLPFNKADFLKTSVAFAGEHWVKRFEDLIKKYPVKVMTSENFDGNAELFSFHGKVLLGTSLLKSQLLHADAGLITVQSQRDLEGKEGGTRDMINTWPFPSKIVRINPDEFHSLPGATSESKSFNEDEIKTKVKPVRFLIKAIIQGMKLDEIDYLIKRIVKLDPPIIEAPHVVVVDEDSLVAAFTSARGAMNFVQLIVKNGKPETMRISLHAGPISIESQNNNPSITGTTLVEINAISSHALTGLIYCSEQVAAILVMERQDLLFHPVGRIDLGEEWKEMEVYTVDLLQ